MQPKCTCAVEPPILFSFRGMPGYFYGTVTWAAKQLREMDWELRHAHMRGLRSRRPIFFEAVCKELSPDESLYGDNIRKTTGTEIIILKDKPKVRTRGVHKPLPVFKQTRLDMYGFKVKKTMKGQS